MSVYSFDPLKDSRWADFIQAHPNSSVFHTEGWLRALQLTYAYQPVVLTTSTAGAKLTNGIVFCRISSWLTGRRMVSLPFADYCEPLVEDAGDREEILSFLRGEIKTGKWKYVEMRPRTSSLQAATNSAEQGSSFVFHTLDLHLDLDSLFKAFQKSSIQRMIRRAVRDGISYEEGRSEDLLQKFYGLLLKTRRRHKVPPQPIAWFTNLIASFGERLTIRVASREGKAIGSILTIGHRGTLVYKYGCSDEQYHNCGAMPFLFWGAIRSAKEAGLDEFDFGRSDIDNPGLITFKSRFGAKSSTLQYVRFAAPQAETADGEHGMVIAKHLFARLPDGLLTTAGKLLYRHIG